MPAKKRAVRPERRTYDSPLEASLPFQLVPQPKQPAEDQQRGKRGVAGRVPVEPPEPKVLSRLIDRIKGL